MKHIKISRWLKLLVLLLSIMGVVFFGGLTVIAFQQKTAQPDSLAWSFIFFSWIIAVLCYGVLFHFWHVCIEIGRDNSFSLENAQSFHQMAKLGIYSAICYFFRIIVQTFLSVSTLYTVAYAITLILLSLVFVVLCESLSQLIKNAYEVKSENDLTI